MFRRLLQFLRRISGGRHAESIAVNPEKRVRVMFTLPCRLDSNEPKAIHDIVEYLEQQRTKQVGVDGFTFSDVSEPVFYGQWWSDDNKEWIIDPIVLFIIDYLRPSTERRFSIAGEIAMLKQVIADAYDHHGSLQEEVWIVYQDVLRQI